MDRQVGQQPVALIGHSLGSAIAARFAAERPDRIERLVLAAPLVDFTASTPSIKLLKIPLLGELLVPLVLKPILKYRRFSFRFCDIEDGRWVDYFYEQLGIPGFGSGTAVCCAQQCRVNRTITSDCKHYLTRCNYCVAVTTVL